MFKIEFNFNLKPPESSNVITALKTHWLQPFIQAAFDGGQPRAACSNHSNTLCHAVSLHGKMNDYFNKKNKQKKSRKKKAHGHVKMHRVIKKDTRLHYSVCT